MMLLKAQGKLKPLQLIQISSLIDSFPLCESHQQPRVNLDEPLFWPGGTEMLEQGQADHWGGVGKDVRGWTR